MKAALMTGQEEFDWNERRRQAQKLKLHGLIANWEDLGREPWVTKLLSLEEEERQRRSLERRLKASKIRDFKLVVDFDWSWPKAIDRDLVSEIFELDFLKDGRNVVFVGSNGLGKTMLAKNLIQQAVQRGFTGLATTASELLCNLAEQDSTRSLARKLRAACQPKLLLIDEVGYQSYDTRYADLLFEVVDRRNQLRRSTVITTNRSFKDWELVFPNASCVVALVDRLIHRAEIVKIEGDSYRLKEAKERQAEGEKRRGQKKAARRSSGNDKT